MDRNELMYIKDLEQKASEELSQLYKKDMKCFFGNTDVNKNEDLARLVVYVVDDDRSYFDNETKIFLDNASTANEIKGFKDMYDIYELEKTRGKLLELENESYGNYIKAMLSIELGINNIQALNSLYQEYLRNEQIQLLNDNFYKRKLELERYKNITKFIDRDADGIDDRIDINSADSRISQIGDMDKIEPYSNLEKEKEKLKSHELER